jgi:hypothetical protein
VSYTINAHGAVTQSVRAQYSDNDGVTWSGETVVDDGTGLNGAIRNGYLSLVNNLPVVAFWHVDAFGAIDSSIYLHSYFGGSWGSRFKMTVFDKISNSVAHWHANSGVSNNLAVFAYDLASTAAVFEEVAVSEVGAFTEGSRIALGVSGNPVSFPQVHANQAGTKYYIPFVQVFDAALAKKAIRSGGVWVVSDQGQFPSPSTKLTKPQSVREDCDNLFYTFVRPGPGDPNTIYLNSETL